MRLSGPIACVDFNAFTLYVHTFLRLEDQNMHEDFYQIKIIKMLWYKPAYMHISPLKVVYMYTSLVNRKFHGISCKMLVWKNTVLADKIRAAGTKY